MVDRDADLRRVDCLQFSGDDEGTIRVVPAGTGERVVVLGPSPTIAAGTLLVGGASLYAARCPSPEGGAPAPPLVATDLPTAEARDRYEVAVASTTPFGSDGTDRRSP
ncbi:hypothetical protein BRC89_13495 [Halobacteriales archaeon QS_4_70_19]|nr:MAG: hypothetical protein BRC89_13495 [Halobacteriales archaeon QS_4_70_19]